MNINDNEYDYKLIGNNIHTLRKMCKLTQQDLADKLQISRRYISHFENADKNHRPSVRMLAEIANYFCVDYDQLLYTNFADVCHENNDFLRFLDSFSENEARIIFPLIECTNSDNKSIENYNKGLLSFNTAKQSDDEKALYFYKKAINQFNKALHEDGITEAASFILHSTYLIITFDKQISLNNPSISDVMTKENPLFSDDTVISRRHESANKYLDVIIDAINALKAGNYFQLADHYSALLFAFDIVNLFYVDSIDNTKYGFNQLIQNAVMFDNEYSKALCKLMDLDV